MTYFNEFEDTIEEIISSHLGKTLADELAWDLAHDCREAIVAELNRGHDFRYVLIDGETGQIESRVLFDTRQEAEKAREEPLHSGSFVALLLHEPLPKLS